VLSIPSLVRLPCVDDDSRLPAVALCDATIDGFDAIESYVSTVTDVDVASLAAAFTVSNEPNTIPAAFFINSDNKDNLNDKYFKILSLRIKLKQKSRPHYGGKSVRECLRSSRHGCMDRERRTNPIT